MSATTPPCPDMDHVKNWGTIIATITGTIGLVALIRKSWNNWKEKHPTFRRTVLKSLDQIKEGQRRFDDFNAAMLRERMESVYNVYVLEMGWCPRSAKINISKLFELYKERFGSDIEDVLVDRNLEVIMDLPESKDQRKDYSQ